jgi:hypothetical protein
MRDMDPRSLMIIPVMLEGAYFNRGVYWDRDGGLDRDKPLQGKAVLRAAVSEWAVRPDRSRLRESFIEVLIDVMRRQMELRPGRWDTERARLFAEKMKLDLESARVQIRVSYKPGQFEVGISPEVPGHLDRMLGNKLCEKCGLLVISGTWMPHTEKECNEKIVRDLMAK